jgi:hypothetical protein
MVCSFTLESTQLNVLCCSHSWYPGITLDMSPSFFETHVKTCATHLGQGCDCIISAYIWMTQKNHSFLL